MLVFDKSKRTNAMDVLKFFIKFKKSENTLRQNEREMADLKIKLSLKN
jgi:hypothetical protein